jgi:hypothetical protein
MANKIYFAGQAYNKSSYACIVDLTTPTFSGISGLISSSDGSLQASWAAGTTSKPRLRYEVYIALGSVSGATLFSTRNNITASFPEGVTLGRVYHLPDQVVHIVKGSTYTVGVRAVDSLGYQDSNTAIQTVVAVASGNLTEVLQDIADSLADSSQKTENASNLIMSVVL